MAISIIKTPPFYAPSKNPVQFTFKSSRASIVYFDVEVTELFSGSIITRDRLYIRPDYPLGVTLNLSSVLDSYVSGEFKPYKSGFVDFFTKPVLRYQVQITEKYLNTAGTAILTGDTHFLPGSVIRGQLDKVTNYNFVRNHYFVGKVPKAFFMTTKPDKVKVNNFSEEGLYFIHDNSIFGLQVVYEFYSKSGWLLGTHSHFMLTDMATYPFWRINCSPAYLKANITGIDFSNLGFYRVRLADPAFFDRSETRTFIYEDLPCNLTPVNVYWENKFGCIDTYQFINPELNQTVTRTTMQKNPMRFNEAGEYTDYSKPGSYAVFNIIDQILEATPEMTMKVWTRKLSDAECTWMSSMFPSKNYWIKADTELYIPVQLQETNWNLLKNRFMDEPNIRQLTFKFSDDYTPDYKITVIPSVPPVIGGGGTGGTGGGTGTPGGGSTGGIPTGTSPGGLTPSGLLPIGDSTSPFGGFSGGTPIGII